MKTLKLNEFWQLEADETGTKLNTLHDKDALSQLISQRLLLIRGEFQLDVLKGVDYFNILGAKRRPEDAEFIAQIEDLGYGIKVTEFTAELDKRVRKYKINLKCKTDMGEIEL